MGLSLAQYSFNLPWVETPLKYSRHASTPFTANIFNQIQSLDYSFLGINHPWEEEISLFKSSGGKACAALQKLSYINLASLSDSSCKELYDVIDLLDDASCLINYFRDFIERIVARGVIPPKCLQSFIAAV